MEPLTIGIIGFVVTMVLAAARVPIALALGFVGVVGVYYIKGWDAFIYVLGTAPVEACRNYSISQLPLFLLMGTFAGQGGMTYNLYRAANAFVGHFRGGLAIATILACGGFGAVCGSSIATVTSMARIAIPEMLRFGYSPRLASGSISAGGTLGILIPPSLLLVVYAFLTETSVGKLFIAGIIPGIVCILLYSATIMISCRINPDLGPATPRTPWPERLRLVKSIFNVFGLFVLVIGGIYFGLFSPTEGAAIGAAGALLLCIFGKTIGLSGFIGSMRSTAGFSSKVFLILIGISYFHFFMDSAEVPEAITAFITGFDAPPIVIMSGIILFLMTLGCVMDSVAIVFIATPFLFPIVQQIGYDLIWFGIMMTMVTEIGLVTPPFGINNFVIAAMDPRVSISDAFKGVAPFIAADFVRIVFFLLFPQVVLWLPNLMMG
jgi:C4-dicarboxylate transporter DctM subunit